MWRYSSLLPRLETKVTHGEGFTPMRRLSKDVYVKLEDRNPTGSYADRASSIVASYMASYNKKEDVTVSYLEDFTLSLTYYIHRYVDSIKVLVDDPTLVNPIEIVLLEKLGAIVEFKQDNKTTHSLHYMNSLTIEGLKTIAFEIIERKPRIEHIIVPTVSGLLAYSIVKGLREAEEAGINHSYSVVAVTLGDTHATLLKHAGSDVKVVEVESRDVIKSMIKLSKTGIWVKPLSAAALAEAENRGKSIALLTSSFRKPLLLPLSNIDKVSRLGEQILSVLKSFGEATAYEIWELLEKKPSLRGVYKALRTLEQSGKVCIKYKVKGSRRVKTYSICKVYQAGKGF